MQDLSEFTKEFSRIYKKLHGSDPSEWNLTQWHNGLYDVLAGMSNVEANISGVPTSPVEWSRYCAQVMLRALDRRTDKAYSFNHLWKRAALVAEIFMGDTSGHIPTRFHTLMASARTQEETTNDQEVGDNTQFRRLLFSQHTCPGKYGDDGEMQCSSCMIDFKRMTPSEIRDGLRFDAEISYTEVLDDPQV